MAAFIRGTLRMDREAEKVFSNIKKSQVYMKVTSEKIRKMG